jgi:hypothetical protein
MIFMTVQAVLPGGAATDEIALWWGRFEADTEGGTRG